MFMTKSKKGLSPLIATILLIAFAVALGSVVVNWGFSFQLGKPADRCSNVKITIRETSAGDACFGGSGANGYINFIIDNIGTADISGLAVWITGEKGTKFFDIDDISIKKSSLYERKDKTVTYDFLTYGNIKQMQFIPKIKLEQISDICPKNAVKAEKISACTQ